MDATMGAVNEEWRGERLIGIPSCKHIARLCGSRRSGSKAVVGNELAVHHAAAVGVELDGKDRNGPFRVQRHIGVAYCERGACAYGVPDPSAAVFQPAKV